MQQTCSYDITADHNGKRDRFYGEFEITVNAPTTSEDGTVPPTLELKQLAERADRGCASEDDLARLLELADIVALQDPEGDEMTFDKAIDAVMAALADKGVRDSDPGSEGWYVSRDDLSVKMEGTRVIVEGAASWGF